MGKAALTHPTLPGGAIASAGCAAGAASFVATADGQPLGGILEAGAITFAEAVAFHFVGAYTGLNGAEGGNVKCCDQIQFYENVAGHALVGGTFSVIRGGKFGSGALAGGFSAVVSPYIPNRIGLAGGTAVSAVIGGTASVIGGGKFGNGALTGAFGYLFNSQGGRIVGGAIGRWVGRFIGGLFGGGWEDLPADYIGGVVGDKVGGSIGDAVTGPDVPNPRGDLTPAEQEQIQSVVNEAGRPVEVVGSAASGTRTAGSDIDYVAPPSSMSYFKGLEDQLPGIDPEHGIIPGVGNPNIGPVIRFEPNQ